MTYVLFFVLVPSSSSVLPRLGYNGWHVWTLCTFQSPVGTERFPCGESEPKACKGSTKSGNSDWGKYHVRLTSCPYQLRLGCFQKEKFCCVERCSWFLTGKSCRDRRSNHFGILPPVRVPWQNAFQSTSALLSAEVLLGMERKEKKHLKYWTASFSAVVAEKNGLPRETLVLSLLALFLRCQLV